MYFGTPKEIFKLHGWRRNKSYDTLIHVTLTFFYSFKHALIFYYWRANERSNEIQFKDDLKLYYHITRGQLQYMNRLKMSYTSQMNS